MSRDYRRTAPHAEIVSLGLLAAALLAGLGLARLFDLPSLLERSLPTLSVLPLGQALQRRARDLLFLAASASSIGAVVFTYRYLLFRWIKREMTKNDGHGGEPAGLTETKLSFAAYFGPPTGR